MKFKQFNFKKVKSTNQTAIRIIKKNNHDFGIIISETQTGGRGQYGRKWISSKGNVFLSFFSKLNKINFSIETLTKKNCLLVKGVVSNFYGKKITFKKPNDLLIDGKKICGILQEKIKKLDKDFLIVGIGFNLVKNPTIPNYPTTNLYKITNKKIDKSKFIELLKKNFEKFLSKYYKN